MTGFLLGGFSHSTWYKKRRSRHIYLRCQNTGCAANKYVPEVAAKSDYESHRNFHREQELEARRKKEAETQRTAAAEAEFRRKVQEREQESAEVRRRQAAWRAQMREEDEVQARAEAAAVEKANREPASIISQGCEKELADLTNAEATEVGNVIRQRGLDLNEPQSWRFAIAAVKARRGTE
jgi:hypothetical protein